MSYDTSLEQELEKFDQKEELMIKEIMAQGHCRDSAKYILRQQNIDALSAQGLNFSCNPEVKKNPYPKKQGKVALGSYRRR